MKVLFIGAYGKVAQHFADLVKNHPEISEKALIRNPDQVPFFQERGIETVVLDIAWSSVDDIARAMEDVDAVIFSAGAGGKGLDKTVAVDLDGAIKTMEAAEQAGVKRYVMVSTFRTGREELLKDNSLRTYTIAKHYADDWLKNRTNLDWTIVHPGILVDDQGSGLIEASMGNDIRNIPRQDVARTLVADLENPATIHKQFEVLEGSTPVEEAIKSSS